MVTARWMTGHWCTPPKGAHRRGASLVELMARCWRQLTQAAAPAELGSAVMGARAMDGSRNHGVQGKGHTDARQTRAQVAKLG